MITMLVSTVVKSLLYAFRYPAVSTDLVGEFRVGVIQARIPGAVACQIHYPTLDEAPSSASTQPYMRPAAVQGIADYSRQSPQLLSFLSQRTHPCILNAAPIVGTENKSKFPIVVFSHGLGGCMEMYTALCQQIASLGYYVVALEHEDGSGAYAESSNSSDKKGPIYYKRPDDTPYSRTKVVNFRQPFLTQRVREIDQVLEYLKQQSTTTTKANGNDHQEQALLQRILEAADYQQGVHLLGHSFGGATMVLAKQDDAFAQRHPIQSLTVLDCWAFSLPDTSLTRGCDHVLSFLSESWLTNPETEQVQELLRNSSRVASYYVPKSVHASFSDAAHWFPGWIGHRLSMRAPGEPRHATVRTVAQAWGQYIRQRTTGQQLDTATIKRDGLEEFPVQARRPEPAVMASSSS
eukprot:scaffold4510_cov183-Amphora_coffeaeformis.AAC.54